MVLTDCLSEKHAEYAAEVDLPDGKMSVAIYSNENTGDIASSIAHARSIVEDFARHNGTVQAFLENDFLPAFCENTGDAVSLNDLIRELQLHDVIVHSDGKFTVSYDACETLHDHCLVLYFSDTGTIVHFDTPG